MLTRTVIAAVVAGAIILAAATQSLARRTAPTTTTAPATRATDKSARSAPKTNTRTPARYDDEDDGPVNARTGKARAQQFEKGKPVDQAKTRTRLDTLTGKVGGLEAALRNSKTDPRTAARYQEEQDLPAQRRKSRRPATQAATQPAQVTKSAKSRYAQDDQ